MLQSIKRALRNPLGVFGTLWPLVLLVPFLPGLPRPGLGGFPWRQELALACLLSVTLALALRRTLKQQLLVPSSLTSRPDFLVLTIASFAICTASSLFWAANPYSAAHHGYQWGAYLLFFLLMRLVAAQPRLLRSTIYSFAVVVWMLSVSCLVEAFVGASLGGSFRLHARPPLRGFSGFGEVMAVAGPMFAAFALDSKRPRRALLCGATAIVVWLATVQSLERAPILGATAGLLLVSVGACIKRGSRSHVLKRTGLLAATLVLSTAALFAPGLLSSDNQNVTLRRFQSTSISEDNTRVRLLFWSAGLEMFRAHPLLGVGANNYEVAFPSGRASFSAAHPNSPLVKMNEEYLAQYAHNEYLQILAELGIVGSLLFLTFCLVLAANAWRAWNSSQRPLLALGAGAGLVAFAISSVASSFSFRWLGGGMAFFFAAALVSNLAQSTKTKPEVVRASASPRLAFATGLVFALTMFVGAGAQATNSVMHAEAQSSPSPNQADHFYLIALKANPFDASTHYDYGLFLYRLKRPHEALPHLRYAVSRGLNTSANYAFLAAVEEEAGDLAGAERTLTEAVAAYPRSVFLLVRYAATLERAGKTEASASAFSNALLVDARTARGWYQLIQFDIDAAIVASRQDTEIATPRELLPQQAFFVVLEENERRLNVSPTTGWRGQMKSLNN